MELAENPLLTPRKMKRYASELFRLKAKYGRELKAKEVFEEGKAKASPLHDFFDWDIRKGWVKWNIHKARMLLCRIRVRVLDDDGKKVASRAFWNVTTEQGEHVRRGYVTLRQVRDEPTYRAQILNDAIEELNEWVNRYAVYRELSEARKTLKRLTATLQESCMAV